LILALSPLGMEIVASIFRQLKSINFVSMRSNSVQYQISVEIGSQLKKIGAVALLACRLRTAVITVTTEKEKVGAPQTST